MSAIRKIFALSQRVAFVFFCTFSIFCSLSLYNASSQIVFASTSSEVSFRSYYYDGITRTAFSLLIGTESILENQYYEFFQQLNAEDADKHGEIPKEHQSKWAHMLYLSQIIEYLKIASAKYVFKQDLNFERLGEGFHQLSIMNPDQLERVVSILAKKTTASLSSYFNVVPTHQNLTDKEIRYLIANYISIYAKRRPHKPSAIKSYEIIKAALETDKSPREFIRLIGPALKSLHLEHLLSCNNNPQNYQQIKICSKKQNKSEKSAERFLSTTLWSQLILNRSADLARNNIYAPETSNFDNQNIFDTLSIHNQHLIDLLNKKFKKTDKAFTALDKISYGFEVEFFSSSIVQAIVPTVPSMRAEWAAASTAERIEILRRLGFEFDNKYTPLKYMIFSALFQMNIDQLPDMEIRPHLEESGRLEVISNGRNIYSIEHLGEAINAIAPFIESDSEPKPAHVRSVSFHFHIFIPDKYFDRLTDIEKHQFVRMLERISLYMSASDYAEVAGVEKPPHRLDSWSLDRFSPRDLIEIENHLFKRQTLNNSQQKYHNIGFRPVKGGIDLELRSIGGVTEVEYGKDILRLIQSALLTKTFGKPDDGPWYFMEPQHYASTDEYKEFTLSEVAKNHDTSLTTHTLALLQKIQFEIYKPVMRNFIWLPRENTFESAPPEDLDVALIRNNFESNVALPLLDFYSRAYFAPTAKKMLMQARTRYIEKVIQLARQIEQDPNYSFLRETDNYLYLADYVSHSTHPSRPTAFMYGPEADRRRELLTDIMYKMRKLIVEFTTETNIDELLYKSLMHSETKSQIDEAWPTNAPKLTCSVLLK